MIDLDLVAMRSAAERFQAVASDENASVSDYVNSYNAYTEAVGVDAVLQLIRRAGKLGRVVDRAKEIDKLQRVQKRALFQRAHSAEVSIAKVRALHSEYVIFEWDEGSNSAILDEFGKPVVIARLCRGCSSDDAIESAGDGEWREDQFHEVMHPCPTIRVLDGETHV